MVHGAIEVFPDEEDFRGEDEVVVAEDVEGAQDEADEGGLVALVEHEVFVAA